MYYSKPDIDKLLDAIDDHRDAEDSAFFRGVVASFPKSHELRGTDPRRSPMNAVGQSWWDRECARQNNTGA